MSSFCKHSIATLIALLCFITSPLFSQSKSINVDITSRLTAKQLRCEYRVDPLGIDVKEPSLSWILSTSDAPTERGQHQTAYRILVSSDKESLAQDQGNIWDSGKVESKSNIQVIYAGKPLESRTVYYWKVCVWDRDGNRSDWSPIASWETSLLDPNEWKAKWISDGKEMPVVEKAFFENDPAPLFRKAFNVEKPVRKARLYTTGLGYGYTRLNGKTVGDHLLATAWTKFTKRILYDTYDVTEQIKQGQNCLGLELGNGWYNPLPLKMWGWLNLREHLPTGRPRGIAQLEIEYQDGTKQTVVTDETWKTTPGPLLRNNIYLGEVYDARREVGPWSEPEFDDSTWSKATIVESPGGELKTRMHPPVRVTAKLKAKHRTEPKPGVFIFDMGQNFAGWIKMRVKGPVGTTVKLRFGELLHPDGTLNVQTSACGQIRNGTENQPNQYPRLAYQSDTYILSGKGEEVYTPRFTWHGFRYVEVTGYPGTPELDAIEGLRLSSDVHQTGSFSCSNARFNKIQKIVEWTFLSNLFDVQSDCPHRERFGYGADLVASCEAFLWNFDMASFYIRALQDFADAARPCGGMTELAPYNGIADDGFGNQTGPIGWQVAFPVLQEKIYQHYGDIRPLRQQYPATKRLVKFLQSQAKDHLILHGIGDHESVTAKPTPLTSTAFYYHHVKSAARFAAILGHEEDAREYNELAEKIRAAFITKFFNPKTGRFFIGTEACQAFALHYGLIPPGKKEVVVDALLDEILNQRKGHLSTGIFGTRYLMRTLSENGHAKVAHTIANQDTIPGWGAMLAQGATTLWECWSFNDNSRSHNHPAFGSVSAWFFEDVAGIQLHPEAVGSDRIIIRPRIAGGLTQAQARHESIRGPIDCQWKVQDGKFILDLSLPPGMTAMVYVPTKDPTSVTEGDKPTTEALGIKTLPSLPNEALVEVASGHYHFEAIAP